MDRRTQTLIAATIVLLGVGVMALGFIEEESGVRYVEQVVDDPAAHQAGTYTLIGELQPPTLPGPNGTVPNDEWEPSITYGERITRDGQTILMTRELAAVQGADRTITWTLTVREQPTDRSGEGDVVEERTWTSEGLLFQMDSFQTDRTVWAVYSGSAELLRKPSQLEGRLVTGDDIPTGAIIFQVDELAQQCSSKFIPEEVQDQFIDTDGDGNVDARAEDAP